MVTSQSNVQGTLNQVLLNPHPRIRLSGTLNSDEGTALIPENVAENSCKGNEE